MDNQYKMQLVLNLDKKEDRKIYDILKSKRNMSAFLCQLILESDKKKVSIEEVKSVMEQVINQT